MKENLIKINKNNEIKLMTSFGGFKKFMRRDFAEKYDFDPVNWKIKDGALSCDVLVYNAYSGDLNKFVKYISNTNNNYAKNKLEEYHSNPDSSISFNITEMDSLLCNMFGINHEGYFNSKVEVNGIVDSLNRINNDDILTFYYNIGC